MPVTCQITKDTALITLNNPPVNAIGHSMREKLLEAIGVIEATPSVKRVIITGAGKCFAAGADTREFGAPPVPPHLPEVLARLERLPAIAAINGAALGGGLEIALACRYRIAAPNALIGLPEVTLGVVPGAGGTQRLPRLVAPALAAELIAEGKTFPADEGLRLGIIDALSDSPLQTALDLPPETFAGRLPLSDQPVPAGDAAAFDKIKQNISKRKPGELAPLQALELVRLSTALPFDEAMLREREAFLTLRQGQQAGALRHVRDIEQGAKHRASDDIHHAVIVGGGNMGAAIAYALAMANIRITLIETDEAGQKRAEHNVGALFDQAVKRGKMSEDAAKAMMKDRFSFAIGYDNLPPAELAIEAVIEDLEVKKQVFAALDAALPPDAILASNTSYLNINKIAEHLRNPWRVLGLHFFSPAHIMKLLEIIKTDHTSDKVLARAFGLAARLKKIPVLAGMCDGFIGNRILTRYRQICDVMLIEGALPWQIDSAMQKFGLAMGPYAVQDLSGLDIAHANRKRMGWRTNPAVRYIPIADDMVENLGRLGRKTDAGWYDYPQMTPSQAVEDLIIAHSHKAGIERREFGDEEIQTRAITAMVAEALAILNENIASSEADIDLVLLHGYGFPRWRGGLMHHARQIGLDQILRNIETYHQADPLSWPLPAGGRTVQEAV